jgi:hypothetical protein
MHGSAPQGYPQAKFSIQEALKRHSLAGYGMSMSQNDPNELDSMLYVVQSCDL